MKDAIDLEEKLQPLHTPTIKTPEQVSYESTSVATVNISEECLHKLSAESVREICSSAKLVGLNAAKQAPELLPIGTQKSLTAIDIKIRLDAAKRCFNIESNVKTTEVDKADMETLLVTAVAALAVFQMVKAIDPRSTIENIKLKDQSTTAIK